VEKNSIKVLLYLQMWDVVLATFLSKSLLFPAYKSTDFEVHRNWLAITHSLRVQDWYLDEHSQWTLDYPPLFAYFECFLSQLATFFDENMLNVRNLNYDSSQTVLFQRLTVVMSELALVFGAKTCFEAVNKLRNGDQKSGRLNWLVFLLLANSGLIMVDNIHFQYNGFLSGIALHSVGLALKGQFVASGFWFSGEPWSQLVTKMDTSFQCC